MLSDFQPFELYDLEEDESVAFPLTDLPKHIATRAWRQARSATASTATLRSPRRAVKADASREGDKYDYFLSRRGSVAAVARRP